MFLGTCALCLFFTLTNTRSFYFSEYEILTAELVNPSTLEIVPGSLLLWVVTRHVIISQKCPTLPNWANIPCHTDCLLPLIPHHRLDLPSLLPTTTLWYQWTLYLWNTMACTKHSAKMCTGGPALWTSLTKPVVAPPMDLQMESVDEVMSSLDDTQVRT